MTRPHWIQKEQRQATAMVSGNVVYHRLRFWWKTNKKTALCGQVMRRKLTFFNWKFYWDHFVFTCSSKNHTKEILCIFYPVSPITTFCQTLWYNLTTKIFTLTKLIQIFPVLLVLLACVCPSQCQHLCRLLYPPPQSRYRTFHHHKDPSCCLFITLSTTHPQSNPRQPQLLPPFLKFCHFKNVI